MEPFVKVVVVTHDADCPRSGRYEDHRYDQRSPKGKKGSLSDGDYLQISERFFKQFTLKSSGCWLLVGNKVLWRLLILHK